MMSMDSNNATNNNSSAERGNLILSRRVGQSLTIHAGEHTVHVRIVETQGHKVRLAIDAPRSVRVRREEQEQGEEH